jgi:magnesium transporter
VIVDCAAYVDGCRQTDRMGLDEIRPWLSREGAFVWLGLRMPAPEELAQAGRGLGIDIDELEEALEPHLRPVLSIRPGLAWVVLRTVHYNRALHRLMLGELSVLVGPSFVLTIRYGQASPLTGLRRRLEAEEGLGSPQALLAAVIDLVIEDYRPALDAFESDAVEAEREVFSSARPRPAKRLLDLKRDVRDLFLAIEPLQEPLARLARRSGREGDPEVMGELEEAADKLSTMVQRVHTLSDLLDAALDANLTQVSLRQNEDMRRISAWVAIAAVPTLIAGIYGMNFETFPELRWRFGYPLVLGLMVVVASLLYRGFRRSGWL